MGKKEKRYKSVDRIFNKNGIIELFKGNGLVRFKSMNTNYSTVIKCRVHQCTNCLEMFSPKLLKKDLIKQFKKYECDTIPGFKSLIRLSDVLKVLKKA